MPRFPYLSFPLWVLLALLMWTIGAASSVAFGADQKPLVKNPTSGVTEALQNGNQLAVPDASGDLITFGTGVQTAPRTVSWPVMTGASTFGVFTALPTANYVPFATTNGQLATNVAFQYNGTNLLTLGVSAGNASLQVGQDNGTATQVIANGAVNTSRGINWRTASTKRWEMIVLDAEPGADAGGKLYLNAFTDAGASIDSPMSFNRAAGTAVVFGRPATFTNTNDSTSASTGSVQINGGTYNAKALTFGANATAFATGTALPTMYGTSASGAAYPFLENGNLVISPRISGGARDVVISNGSIADFKFDRAGALNIGTTSGTTLTVNSTTAATSKDAASVVLEGGAGIEKEVISGIGFGVGVTPTTNLPLALNVSNNGSVNGRIANANTGTSANASFVASNGTATVQLYMLGTNFTTAGIEVANAGGITTSNAAGMILVANNASSGIKFATGGQTQRMEITSTGTVNVANDVVVTTAGKGYSVKEGSNAKMGIATLVAGSVVVSTTAVTASSRIQLTSNVDGGTPGWLRVSARTGGTSFTITSSSGTDTSQVAWIIFEPAP